MLSELPPSPEPRFALQPGGPPGAGRNGGAPGRNGGGAAPSGVVGMLNVIGGNDRGKTHPLTRPTTSIGRGADQDCILADIAVSRRHITISIEGARYRFKDLGSGNGSLLNGTRTDTAILNDGDQIEIGNTLLRFEHSPSRPVAAAGAPPPASMRAESGAATMMADAGVFPLPAPQPAQRPGTAAFPAPDPHGGGYGGGAPIQMPPPGRPAQSPLPAPLNTGTHASPGLLDTPAKKVAVFGTLGLVLLLGAAVVVKKVVFGGEAKARELTTSGIKLFSDGEYEGAKKLFAEAVQIAPESAAQNNSAKYLKQCDLELKAKEALKQANKLTAAKQWEDALKKLDAIDKASAAYEDAEKLKKTALPAAVAANLNEARQAMDDDADTAQQKVDAALALDPDNEEAQELDRKLKTKGGKGGDGKVAGKDKDRDKDREKDHGSQKEEHASADRDKGASHDKHKDKEKDEIIAPSHGSKEKGGSKKGGDDDDELASVSSGSAGGDVLSVKGAANPYKAKDWSGAASAVKAAAKGEKPKNADKLNQLASQVTLLGNLYTKAEADKGKSAAQALSEYQQALAIDQKIGKGTHGAYFKGQLGKLAQQAAQDAFKAQKFDVAYDAVKTAQKFGSGDGGVGAQLKAKASELNGQAAAKQKKDLNGAKTLWRMVVKMVPPTDPAYATAYKALNSASAAGKDDDE